MAILALIYNGSNLPKQNLLEVFGLLILFGLSILATHQFRYTKPSLFLFVILTTLLIVKLGRISLSNRSTILSVWLFIFLSFLLILDSSKYTYDGRFFSFLLTPTVLSVNATAFLALFFGVSKSKILRLILVILFLLLVLLTKTRINLLAILLIPLLFFLFERNLYSKRSILWLFMLIFVFVYPIYQYILDAGYFKSFLMMRYSDGRDASFGMRYYLHSLSFDLFIKADWMEKLFGQGSEFSRLYILNLTGEDSYSHNDFLRLLIDFGAVFTVLFVGIMARIALKSRLSTVLFILYLSSFYHNMVFDFFLPSLIILFSDSESITEQRTRNGLVFKHLS